MFDHELNEMLKKVQSQHDAILISDSSDSSEGEDFTEEADENKQHDHASKSTECEGFWPTSLKTVSAIFTPAKNKASW